MPTATPGLYQGPLFDTHLHLSPQTPDSAEEFLNYLDRRGVSWAIMFHIFEPEFEEPWVAEAGPLFLELPVVAEYIEGVRSRVIHLYNVIWWHEEFPEGVYTQEIISERIRQGPFHGVGEIALYYEWPRLESVAYSGPAMQAIFRAVNEKSGIVMIHPPDGNWGSVQRPEDPTELEEVVRSWPNVTFLFHGLPNVLTPLLFPLVEKYPNVYYTYDVIHMIIGEHHMYGGERIWDPPVEYFLENVERVGVDTIVEWGIRDSAAWFEQHPERIVWGTDLFGFNWEEPAAEKFMEIGRKFISRLPEDLQEDYAYKNALRVFGKYLVPPQ